MSEKKVEEKLKNEFEIIARDLSLTNGPLEYAHDEVVQLMGKSYRLGVQSLQTTLDRYEKTLQWVVENAEKAYDFQVKSVAEMALNHDK